MTREREGRNERGSWGGRQQSEYLRFGISPKYKHDERAVQSCMTSALEPAPGLAYGQLL